MGGGGLPHGFPQPNPTTSYWQLPPHRIANHRTTADLPTSTTHDYIIIGSGISGAAIAHKLLSRDPSCSILMLEARTAASGASGRNGGHCRAGWWYNFSKYSAAFGEDEAIKFGNLEEQNVRDIADFVREHDVDCDFRDVETADTYSTKQAWEGILEVARLREEASHRRPDMESLGKRQIWHGKEASERVGLPNLLGAVTYPAHTLNPYRLVCRMLDLSLDKGLNLQTDTPAYAVAPSQEGNARWEVQTDRGTVRAKQVILATNAYTNALHSGLANTGFLLSSRSQVTAIKPKTTDLSNRSGMSAGVNDRGSGDYFLIRAPGLSDPGDVLYGGGRGISKTREMGITDDSCVNDDIAAYLKRSAPEVFGNDTWGGEKSEEIRDWSGITCYTPDTFPMVGELPGEKELWATIGMNGHGMAMAYRSGEALVTMMTTGEEPEWFPRSFRLGRAWEKQRVNLRPTTFMNI